MPVISMFYSIIAKMFNNNNQKYHLSHIYVEYQDFVAVVAIDNGVKIFII